jgi:hypothetical protein
MVFNFSQLIKISSNETHPAAKTQSIGLPAYAQLAQVFAEPSGSFTVTPNSAPSTGILPSTGIIPSGSFVWTTRPSAIYRDFYLDQKDYVRLPGFCKNSCQRVPLSATN